MCFRQLCLALMVRNHKCEPLIKVKHLKNVGVLDLYRLNVITTMSIYLVTQLLEIYYKNILITEFLTISYMGLYRFIV